ncbi:DUF1684 domain-containing protein [Frankia sp. QA3]|uniref:DUF1684 domain-containing protein n=1 Tax=Frankia sp. QA3 TaxID=710111 RepID=UPI000269C1A5|nr:DUF1684 domain-containing protein [Frankia sp. QA3]EIV92587.1 hypothetical protein FraQA3DRAFT_2173 [Frankia sp. QA3]
MTSVTETATATGTVTVTGTATVTETATVTGTASAAASATARAEWDAWREASERQRREPYGFLAYSALHFLDGEPRRVEGFPGRWATGEQGPVVDLDAGESLAVDGETVAGRHVFGAVREREFRRAASFGDVVVELSRRGGHDLLRSLDPRHRLRETYVRTPTFDYDPAWVVRAEFEPYPAPRPVEVAAAIDGIVHTHEAVGEAVFALDGTEQRLVLFHAEHLAGVGLVLFTDATSGVTTYAASRRLIVPLPAPGSTQIVLDFNRAGNLQCAYTPYAPCPLAPPQNRLTIPIEAGEQIPSFRPEHDGTAQRPRP